jgi:hypothetical protein
LRHGIAPWRIAFAAAATSICLGGCKSASGSFGTPVAPTITTQPTNQKVSVDQPATFSVVATGTVPLNYQWQENGASISGAPSATYTIAAATAAQNGHSFQVIITNSAGSITSAAATLTVLSPGGIAKVLTYHNDNARTGQNLTETILTPATVSSAHFGKVAFLPVQGLVDAEPLYLSGLMVNGATHNVVFVATEHDFVYAFDADAFTQLWQVSVDPGESPSDDRGCSQVTPEIGVTSTPAIDLNAGPHGTMYLVAMSKDAAGKYHQRVHALDITTGAELAGGPQEVTATFPGSALPTSNGQTIFDPAQYKERVGLLLLNGVLYTGWASHCDFAPYSGWILGYNAATLKQVSLLNFTPNGSEGSAWMSGAGLAADSSGNIYFLVANGTFDTTLDANGFPNNGDFGNAFLKLSTSGGALAVADYFTMFNTVNESNIDQDLGSGGALVLPDFVDASGTTRHLAVGAGKDDNIYVVDRDSMGKFNPNNNNAIYQEIPSGTGLTSSRGVFAMPAYFNNQVYYGAVDDALRAFTITNAQLSTPAASVSASTFGYPGTTPSISANGSSNGIVWAVQSTPNLPAILHAYDATNLANELYNSNQAGGRDQFTGNKFVTPMIANGKVFVGTPTGVAVFGSIP